MAPPLTFVYGNCAFASSLSDVWAAFVLSPASYAWLPVEEKRARMNAFVGALEAVEADLQLLRLSVPWRESHGSSDGARAHGGTPTPALRSYQRAQAERTAELTARTPHVFLIASLREPARDLSEHVSQAASRPPGEWWRSMRRAVTLRDRGMLPLAELERIRLAADRVHARLAAYLEVRPARGPELQWLVRRAFCRDLAEPGVDAAHEPAALLFEHNGEAVLAPLEGDVMRWADGCIEQRPRSLVVESEAGTCLQTFLVLGALPERVSFPGSAAELMFAPLEQLPFGVDLSLNARFLPNRLALRLVRRSIQDADQILRAEADGEQGASDLGWERTQEARDLLALLQTTRRPPMLRATLSLAVAAADVETLEERVEACRRAYGEVRLHRPLGDQLELFLQHLPAQRTRVAGYEDVLTAEQIAAMMPTACHTAGSERGFYLGHTLSGSRRPVRFSLREGSDRDRNTTVLSVGALGSGKTTLAQKLAYEGFLQGARVVDCDPKGDHRFHLLEDVAPEVESVTLRPDPALRGMLDPLRVAPQQLRHDATVAFLRDLLPHRAEARWETALVAAVDRVIRTSRRPTCTEVVRALRETGGHAAEVGEALEVHARSGLTQLGFADASRPLPKVGERQVTYLPIRDLPAPAPGVSRAEYSQAERVGEQIVRLIAMFAMRLMSAERERLKIFSFDEGWRLLGDPVGRSLLASLQRMGRSELAVPIISTQLVGDALLGERESFENLIGATFVFGMRSEGEAARALRLIGLDGEDRALRRALLDLDAGRCLFRDHRGRVEAVQVELVARPLIRAFSTTPANA